MSGRIFDLGDEDRSETVVQPAAPTEPTPEEPIRLEPEISQSEPAPEPKLLACPDCGHGCSRYAEACPGCGRFFEAFGHRVITVIPGYGWVSKVAWGIVVSSVFWAAILTTVFLAGVIVLLVLAGVGATVPRLQR